MLPKPVSSSHVTISQIMQPGDANFLGKVFGGVVLSMCDLAAYASATKFAGNICVTASLDRVDFLKPIDLGELVTLEARVSYVGRTSVEVTIDVRAENIYTGESRHTNRARMTMVAIKDGKPTEVPRLICETREEKILYIEGKLKRELRGMRQNMIEDLVSTLEHAPDGELDALIAKERLTDENHQLLK